MTTDYEVDLRFVTVEEAVEYLHALRGRERRNHRRVQAWFDHCERIRSHPSSMIAVPAPPPNLIEPEARHPDSKPVELPHGEPAGSEPRQTRHEGTWRDVP